jgi:hypothetical protein
MATIVAQRSRLNGERRFFTFMAAAMVAVTLIGFAPTYYLSRFTGAPALGPLVHLHGVVFTAWILLFFGQTSLIAARRPDIHRMTGMALAVLAVASVVLGVVTAIEGARAGHGPFTRNQPAFLIFPFTLMALFAGFTALGVAQRKRAADHKRWMLLATMALVTTPLARVGPMIGMPFQPPAISGMILMDVFLAALVVFDIKRLGRLHPVTLWGGGVLLASEPLRVLIGNTQAWQAFAHMLIG